ETRDGVKPISEVQVGEEVLTHTGTYRPVKVCARRWHEGKIYRLTISGSNETVRITGEHPVYVLRPAPCVLAGRAMVPCRPTCQLQQKCSAPRPHEQYQLEWVSAEDVQAGDVVVFPRRRIGANRPTPFIPIPYDKVLHRQHLVGSHEVPLDKDLAKFLGYFISEGNAQERGL